MFGQRFADEVVATDDLGAREQAVVGGGARIVDHQVAGARGNDREWPAQPGRQRRPCGFVCGLRARTAELRVRVVDAAVDHRDANALAGGAERVRGGRADVRHGLREIVRIVGDADHAVIAVSRDSAGRSAASTFNTTALSTSCTEATTSVLGAAPSARSMNAACSAATARVKLSAFATAHPQTHENQFVVR